MVHRRVFVKHLSRLRKPTRLNNVTKIKLYDHCQSILEDRSGALSENRVNGKKPARKRKKKKERV